MRGYSVGPDELSSYILEQMTAPQLIDEVIDESGSVQTWSQSKWSVYWYEQRGYEGSGESVWLDHSGKLWTRSLSHNSCYGPMYNAESVVSIDEFLREKDDVHDCDWRPEVKAKVSELLSVAAEG